MADYDDDRPDFDDGSNRDFEIERAAMLARFEKELATDPRSIRYDEDEWLMLADYASDEDNFYLFSEAVMRGLIAYPDSSDLSDRRLLLLNDVCNPAELRKIFNAAASVPGATKIARLYKAFYDWEDAPSPSKFHPAYKEIRKIALDSVKLTDQELIETVKILADMNALPLMIRDIRFWVSETEYPETLWYELAATLFEQANYDAAAQAVEHLVSDFPYNQRYWMLKARIYFMAASEEPDESDALNHKYEIALDALETANAIDPDDEEVKKFREYFVTGSDSEQLPGNDNPDGSTKGTNVGNELASTIENFIRTTPRHMIFAKMSSDLMLMLLDSDSDEARRVITDWISDECDTIGKGPVLDKAHKSRLSTIIESIYIADRPKDVDSLLAMAEEASHDPQSIEPLLMLKLLRTIETENMTEADRLLARMLKVYDWAENVDFELVRSIVERRRGRPRLAEECYYRYRNSLFSVLSFSGERDGRFGQKDREAAESHGVSPAVAHFLVRRLFSDEVEL